MQKLMVTHETPARSAPPAEFGTVGMTSGDQVEPSHNSAVVAGIELSYPFPTAMQNTEVTHETPWSPFAAFGVAVVGIVVQFDALTCAGAVSAWEFAAPPALPPVRASGRAVSATAKPSVTIRTTDRIPNPNS
jgi:hypothetical protein